MDFIIQSLKPSEFEHLFPMSDSELENFQTVHKKPSFPCRITLEDAEIGEEVLLLNYEFHSVSSPYKASGPIYVRVNKNQKICVPNEVPPMFLSRLISLRGYNQNQMLISAEVFEGQILKEKIQSALENPEIDYLHIHNAKHGCYLAKATRI